MSIEIGKENALEKFLVIGRTIKEVNLFGQKITLQVLNSGEQEEVFNATSVLETIARMRAIQRETLARAIIALNGFPVTYVPKEKDELINENKLIHQNLETLKKSPQRIIELLYEEYDKLTGEQNKQIDELKKKFEKIGQNKDGQSVKQ